MNPLDLSNPMNALNPVSPWCQINCLASAVNPAANVGYQTAQAAVGATSSGDVGMLGLALFVGLLGVLVFAIGGLLYEASK